MPIEYIFAKLQIGRLVSTEGYGFLKENKGAGIKDLASCLAQRADNDSQAQRIITRCLESSPKCPTVAGLIEIITWVQSEAEPPPVKCCKLCGGAGIVYSYELCERTRDGTLLRRPIPGGYWDAVAIQEGWRQEERDWSAAHPRKPQPQRRDQYIGQAGRRCACNPAKAVPA